MTLTDWLTDELDPVRLTDASEICSEGKEIEELEDLVTEPLMLEDDFVTLTLWDELDSLDLVTLTEEEDCEDFVTETETELDDSEDFVIDTETDTLEEDFVCDPDRLEEDFVID